MRSRIGRNEPCLCGSGKKYKQCCEGKAVEKGRRRARLAAFILAGIVLVGTLGFLQSVSNSDRAEAPRRVWSEEHGHWH